MFFSYQVCLQPNFLLHHQEPIWAPDITQFLKSQMAGPYWALYV